MPGRVTTSGSEVVAMPSPVERLNPAARALPESPRVSPPIFPENPGGDGIPAPDAGSAPPRWTLPQLKPRGWSWNLIALVLMVVVPFLGSTIYYGLIASNEYVSEFHFSVRSQNTVSAPPSTPGGSGSTATITSTMTNQADPEDLLSSYAVVDYINSSQAVDDVSAKLPLKSYYSDTGADWFSRLESGAPRERVTRYWRRMVFADYDEATGLATVKVLAFRPGDAYALASELVRSAERLVNEMEDRARQDALAFAQKLVNQDTAHVEELNRKLLSLRKNTGTIDPEASFVSQNNQVALALVQSLVQLRTQYAATLSQMHNNPDAPTLRGLRDQIAATEAQLAETRADIGSAGKGAVLPTVVGEFEQTQLEMQLAQQSLTASIANLEAARASAIAQTLYVLEQVKPHLPESADYPKRFENVLLIGLGGLGLWVAGSLMVSTVRNRLA